MTPERRRAYDEDIGIPRQLKWVLVSIKEIGLPAVFALLMFWFATVSLKTMTIAIQKQSLDLETLIVTINSNHNDSKQWRDQLLADIRDLRAHLR